MTEYDDDGGKLPHVDHGPLNEGAVGKTKVTVVVWDGILLTKKKL